MREQVLAVQRMQDYIAAHLGEEITMAALARASFFSPWHSYRLFRQYTGLTPADYIRRLRLARSALRLKNEGRRVTEVAFELGFGSVDGYQRAFYAPARRALLIYYYTAGECLFTFCARDSRFP